MKPLYKLLKKETKFEWIQECTNALNALIKQVATNPVLVTPNGDEPFKLETNASTYAVWAALFQKDKWGK